MTGWGANDKYWRNKRRKERMQEVYDKIKEVSKRGGNMNRDVFKVHFPDGSVEKMSIEDAIKIDQPEGTHNLWVAPKLYLKLVLLTNQSEMERWADEIINIPPMDEGSTYNKAVELFKNVYGVHPTDAKRTFLFSRSAERARQ